MPSECRFLTYPGGIDTFTDMRFDELLPPIYSVVKAGREMEVFFKWIKQNLKIKSFLGTSRNAVLSQIWVAMCYYLLLAFIKYQTKYRGSLQVLTRMIAAVVMEQRLLIEILSFNDRTLKKARAPVAQLALF